MEYRERFGALVRKRRRELGLRQIDLKGLGGPSWDTVRKIEGNKWDVEEPQSDTLRGLDIALDWRVGSSEAVLSGGEPAIADVEAARRAMSEAGEGWVALPGWMLTELVSEVSRLSLLTRDNESPISESISRTHTLASDMLALVMAAERKPEDLPALLERLRRPRDGES